MTRVLFDALEESFKGTEVENIIDSLYAGELIDYLRCIDVDYQSERIDKFLDLALAIIPFGATEALKNLSECIDAYVRPEILDGENKYYADCVKRKVTAIKGLKFGKLPQIMSVQLKRFVYDFSGVSMIQKKVNDAVSFPMLLDMNKYVAKRSKSVSKKKGNISNKNDFTHLNDSNNTKENVEMRGIEEREGDGEGRDGEEEEEEEDDEGEFEMYLREQTAILRQQQKEFHINEMQKEIEKNREDDMKNVLNNKCTFETVSNFSSVSAIGSTECYAFGTISNNDIDIGIDIDNGTEGERTVTTCSSSNDSESRIGYNDETNNDKEDDKGQEEIGGEKGKDDAVSYIALSKGIENYNDSDRLKNIESILPPFYYDRNGNKNNDNTDYINYDDSNIDCRDGNNDNTNKSDGGNNRQIKSKGTDRVGPFTSSTATSTSVPIVIAQPVDDDDYYNMNDNNYENNDDYHDNYENNFEISYDIDNIRDADNESESVYVTVGPGGYDLFNSEESTEKTDGDMGVRADFVSTATRTTDRIPINDSGLNVPTNTYYSVSAVPTGAINYEGNEESSKIGDDELHPQVEVEVEVDKCLSHRHMPSTEEVDKLIEKRGDNFYELYAVLNHSGAISGGHYFAYIKNLDSKKWYNFNDSNVTEISEEKVCEAWGGKSKYDGTAGIDFNLC